MSFTKYSKWDGIDWSAISLEDLMDRLSEFLLQSGFQNPYSRSWYDADRSLESLR